MAELFNQARAIHGAKHIAEVEAGHHDTNREVTELFVGSAQPEKDAE